MATGTDSSYGSQLVEMQGAFKLAYPMLPELGCLLTELAENGCRGQILFKFVPDPVAHSWKRCLGPNRPVRVRIEGHPVVGNLQLDCIVNKVQDTRDATNVELWFNQLTPGQMAQLKKAAEHSGAKAIMPVGAPQMPILVSGDPSTSGPHPAEVPVKPANPPRPPSASKMPPPPPPPPPKLPPRPPSNTAPKPVLPAAAATVAPRAPVAPVIPAAQEISPPLPPAPVQPVAQAAEDSGPATAVPIDEDNDAMVPPQAAESDPSRQQTASLEITPPVIPLQQAPAPRPVSDAPARPKGKLGDILIQMGKLTQEQIDNAAAEARARHEKLGRFLVRTELLTPDALCRALALQSGLPMTDLTDLELPQNLAKLFPHALMLRHCFIPFDENASFVCVATSNPISSATVSELERIAQRKVEVFLAREDYVLQHISTLRGRQADVPRRHIRYDIAMPVHYQFCTRLGSPVEVTQHEGMTVNISEGGLLVNGPKASRVGTVQDVLRKGLCLSIVLGFGTQTEIRCICRIKSIREMESGWNIGMQLVDTTEDDRRRLKEVCVKALMKK